MPLYSLVYKYLSYPRFSTILEYFLRVANIYKIWICFYSSSYQSVFNGHFLTRTCLLWHHWRCFFCRCLSLFHFCSAVCSMHIFCMVFVKYTCTVFFCSWRTNSYIILWSWLALPSFLYCNFHNCRHLSNLTLVHILYVTLIVYVVFSLFVTNVFRSHSFSHRGYIFGPNWDWLEFRLFFRKHIATMFQLILPYSYPISLCFSFVFIFFSGIAIIEVIHLFVYLLIKLLPLT